MALHVNVPHGHLRYQVDHVKIMSKNLQELVTKMTLFSPILSKTSVMVKLFLLVNVVNSSSVTGNGSTAQKTVVPAWKSQLETVRQLAMPHVLPPEVVLKKQYAFIRRDHVNFKNVLTVTILKIIVITESTPNALTSSLKMGKLRYVKKCVIINLCKPQNGSSKRARKGGSAMIGLFQNWPF